MKKVININKSTLINSIANNSIDFGHKLKGLYVDVDGNITCIEKSDKGNLMPIITFSGMENYIDDNGWKPENENYDANAVSQNIVSTGECMMAGGSILSEDGTTQEFNFYIQ
jgi:hypothetical protein